MKKILLPVLCLFLTTMLSGCGLMEGAFKAGFWFAIIIALLVGMLIWIFHFSYHKIAARYPQFRLYIQDLINQ